MSLGEVCCTTRNEYIWGYVDQFTNSFHLWWRDLSLVTNDDRVFTLIHYLWIGIQSQFVGANFLSALASESKLSIWHWRGNLVSPDCFFTLCTSYSAASSWRVWVSGMIPQGRSLTSSHRLTVFLVKYWSIRFSPRLRLLAWVKNDGIPLFLWSREIEHTAL